MEITYLCNSGFAFSNKGDLLIIDYYNFSPKKGTISDGVIDSDYLRAHANVTVLASHDHGDHYNRQIFSFLDVRKDIKYLLSSDIEAPKNICAEIEYINEHETRTINSIEVRAYGSTDKGVSFDMRWDGLRLFHAGDFNDWHWRNEGDEEWTRNQEIEFARILSEIEKEPSIDIALFPVDPRMGENYYSGALRFARALAPKHMIPMHFGEKFNAPDSFICDINTITKLLPIPFRGYKITI